MTYEDFFPDDWQKQLYGMFTQGDPMGAGVSGLSTIMGLLNQASIEKQAKRDWASTDFSNYTPPPVSPNLGFVGQLYRDGASGGPMDTAVMRRKYADNDENFRWSLAAQNAARQTAQMRETAARAGNQGAVGAYPAFLQNAKANQFMGPMMKLIMANMMKGQTAGPTGAIPKAGGAPGSYNPTSAWNFADDATPTWGGDAMPNFSTQAKLPYDYMGDFADGYFGMDG